MSGNATSSFALAPPTSVSMMVDHGRRTRPHVKAAASTQQCSVRILKVQPRSAHAWTADDAVTECHACTTAFGALTRRHHCRACGSIFCYTCCSRHARLPRDIFRYPIAPKSSAPCTKAERVCDACFAHVTNGSAIWTLVRVFDALGLDMIALRRVAMVCRDWCAASMWSLSTLREVQYTLPSQQLSRRERNMLLINSALLRGHGAWAVPLARVGALDSDAVPTSEPTTSCRFTMCTRYCRRGALRAHDALQLLRAPTECRYAARYATVAVAVMAATPEPTYLYLLPCLTFELRRCTAVRALLVRRAKASERVRTHTFWLLRMWRRLCHSSSDDAATAALYERTMNSVSSVPLRAGERIVECMMKGDRAAVEHESRVAVSDGGAFVMPVVADHACTRAIDTSSCRKMESSTSPTRYTLHCGVEQSVDVLAKPSDVRADLVAVGVLQYMIDVLRTEESLDLGVVTYNVMPVDDRAGLIEMVRNAHTLYDIRHRRSDGSVIKYIVNNANPDEPLRAIRARFVRSTAAFTVMTYLLGVGDRHLSNVMVTSDGRLFHIDYGYMIGADPKPMVAPAMRLSADMLEVIGAQDTASYRSFQRLCTRIYTCLRRHVAPIGAMLSLLVDMDIVERATLDEHLLRRFVPGADVVEAQLLLTRRIDECRTSTVSQSAIDLSHHQARTIAHVSSSIARPVRGMFESFEAWWFKPTAAHE